MADDSILSGGASAPDAAGPAVVAPDSTATPGTTATPSADGTSPAVETKLERTYSQSEFDTATARIRQKEARRAERIAYERARREIAEQELQRLREPSPDRSAAPTSSAGEPRPENFKDWDTYNRAVVRWEIQQTQAQREVQSRAEGSQRAAYERAAKIQEAIVKKGAAKYEDFDDVALADDLQVTDAMGAAIFESKVGHDVLYYLGQHPDEATRISQLSPAAQVREVDKIEATLTKPPEVSKAPDPIKPNAGTGAAEKDYSDLPFKEFAARRRREEAQRR